jgi:flavin reductase (DIM6/NTAB) family NADH-FMN oxidoreductase RutF
MKVLLVKGTQSKLAQRGEDEKNPLIARSCAAFELTIQHVSLGSSRHILYVARIDHADFKSRTAPKLRKD